MRTSQGGRNCLSVDARVGIVCTATAVDRLEERIYTKTAWAVLLHRHFRPVFFTSMNINVLICIQANK